MKTDEKRQAKRRFLIPSALQWLLLLTAMLVAFQFFGERKLGESLPYSQFLELNKARKVENLIVTEKMIRGDRILAEGKSEPFFTVRMDPELAAELQASGTKFTQVYEDNSLWSRMLAWLPFLVILYLLFRPMMNAGGRGGGILSIGKSRAKIYMESDTKTSFADVAGVDEAKAELEEVVHFLKDPTGYGKLGAHMPKGVLLVGPPGTGKTLLAKAVAGEAGVPFFSINGSEFVEMFVGVGAARVRDLFAQAREKSPCIIFIDELDALGRSRVSGGPGGMANDEKEQTLNQLLSELDGFDAREGIILVAATNRPEILDPALLRAGRFDRQILVDRPDKPGRLAILKVHIARVKPSADVDLEAMAAMTPGFTGADLANLVNEAALNGTRRSADSVTTEDFTNALERLVAGLEKRSRLLNPLERRRVAYHEMGHALVASVMSSLDRIHKVSIIPRGIGALGYTIQRPTEDRYLITRTELEAKICVLMGGRAAEEVAFSQISTGAADDIAKATDIARSMVTVYGMDASLGPLAYSEPSSSPHLSSQPGSMSLYRAHSEETQREIDECCRQILQDCINRAVRCLRMNRKVLDDAAKLLIEKETLTEAELGVFFRRMKPFEPQTETPGVYPPQR